MSYDPLKKEIEKAIRTEQNTEDEGSLSALQERLTLYRALAGDDALGPVIRKFTEKDFSDAIRTMKEAGTLYSLKGDYLPISVFCYRATIGYAASFFVEKSINYEEFVKQTQRFFKDESIVHFRCQRPSEKAGSKKPKSRTVYKKEAPEIKPTGEVLEMEVPFGLKYFHFLTTIGLYLAAIYNFLYALRMFSYERIYRVTLPASMKSANILYGIGMIGMAIYVFVARNKLATFKKDAVRFFLGGIVVCALLDLLYAFIASAGEGVDDVTIWSQCIGTVIRRAVYFTINYIYFKKRKIMFTK